MGLQVRLQDAGLALASLATSALGAKMVWTTFRDRYTELHGRFSDTGAIYLILHDDYFIYFILLVGRPSPIDALV